MPGSPIRASSTTSRPFWRARCSSASDLAVPAAEKKDGIAAFAGNHALCKITEDLIFTDPYRVAEQNRWTQPWLDATAAAFREDLDLHVAISRLKVKFMASPEALIHGDLHTGSIMVTDSSTMVIDPEFAFYGPMGFDIGAVIANLLMSYLASIGHERSPGERRAFEAWVLETVESVWTEFARKFLELWRTAGQRRRVSGDPIRRRRRRGASGDRAAGLHGAATPATRSGSRPQRSSAAFWAWRTISISNGSRIPKRRAISEARSLRLARAMMVDAASFRTIGAVTKAAQEARDWEPEFAK